MIQEYEYIASHRPYLIRPGSFRKGEKRQTPDGRWVGRVNADALWFRRKRGVLTVTFGELWDYSEAEDFDQFLNLFDTGRYGGTAVAQWDGEKLWTPTAINETARQVYIDMLEPVLLNFPDIPAAYVGWFDIRDKR